MFCERSPVYCDLRSAANARPKKPASLTMKLCPILFYVAPFLLSHDLCSHHSLAHTDTGPHTPWHSRVCVAQIKVHSQRGGGKKPRNVTDVFVLIVALLLPLSLRLSIHHQLHRSLSLSLCHLPISVHLSLSPLPSIAHISACCLSHCRPFSPHFMQNRVVSYEITQYQFIISWEFPPSLSDKPDELLVF